MVDRRFTAWSGILSGIGLTVETALFIGSGWTVDPFATLDGAAAAMAEDGKLLRWAVVFGVINFALLTVFLAGLAGHLGSASQSLRSAILHVGLVGIAVHAIVLLGFYQAVFVLARLLWRAFSSLLVPFARRRWGFGSRAMNVA